MRNAECIYCEEIKPVKIWKETGEEVCYDCRLDFLDEEFEDPAERKRKREEAEKAFNDMFPSLDLFPKF